MDEREVDRLYSLPLEEFTRERNELVKRLRAEGDRAGAEEARVLQKPTVAAWAVNQLARGSEVQVRALLRAGEKLRDAQRKVLAGGDAKVLRDAQRDERESVSRLVRDARKLLPGASDATLERVAETLRAAAIDDEGRELLKRGRLTRELETSGFGLVEGMPVRERPRARAKAKPKADDARARRLAAARERVKELRAAAREAERDATRAQREAERAARALEDAEAALARLDE